MTEYSLNLGCGQGRRDAPTPRRPAHLRTWIAQPRASADPPGYTAARPVSGVAASAIDSVPTASSGRDYRGSTPQTVAANVSQNQPNRIISEAAQAVPDRPPHHAHRDDNQALSRRRGV